MEPERDLPLAAVVVVEQRKFHYHMNMDTPVLALVERMLALVERMLALD